MKLSRLASPVIAALVSGCLLAISPSLAPDATAVESPESVEVPSLRTRTSQTFREPNGTFRTVVSSGPMHFRDATRSWQPIRSRLVGSGEPGYAWQNEANGFRTLFRRQLGADFLRLEINGKPLTVSLAGAAPSFATVLHSQVQYLGAFPNVDLTYEVLADGLKESLVLNRPTAPTTYVFTFTAPPGIPLRARRLTDGSWGFFMVERDDPLFVLAPPSIGDSGDAGRSAPVTMSVVRSGAQFTVSLTVDSVWLHDSSRRFPVVLDPTVRIQPPAEDASFDAACAICLPLLDKRLNIGTDTSHIWRSALAFDLGDVPSGASLISANLNLYYQGICLPASGAGSCAQQTHQIDVHRITSGWTTSTPSSALTYSPTVIRSYTIPLNAPEQWMGFDITATVSDWLAAAQPNYGVLLKRSSETLDRGGPRPPGRRYEAEGTLKPYLDVRWASDGVDLLEPTIVHSDGAELNWTQYAGAQPFQRYEVHRSPTPRFTPSPATLLTTITDPAVTTFRDTTATPEETATYKVVANTSPSNERTVTLPSEDLTTQVLQPDPAAGKATYLHFSTDLINCTNNGARDRMFVGSDTKSIYRPLVSFDLSAIPAGAYIAEANLSLWNSLAPQRTATVEVHEVTTSWVEGTGNQACTGDGATWYQAGVGPGQNWTVPGGDFEPEPTASIDRVASSEPQWDEVDIAGTVQQWLNGELPNYGVLLKLSDESLISGNNFAYVSDDWMASPTLRPKLTLTFATDDLEGETTDVPVDPNVPDDSLEPSTDPFDDPTHIQQVGTPDPPPAAPEPPVIAYVTSNGVSFRNNDGRWTIYVKCIGIGPNRARTVGAGYVARFIDRLGRRVVDDERPPSESPLAGGLGMFGWHSARGVAGNLNAVDNPDRFKLIEGRRCAEDNGLYGPYAAELPDCPDVLNCSFIDGNVGRFSLDVWFRDLWGASGHGPNGNGIMRVRYRWRFYPNTVRMWAAVTEWGESNAAGVPFVKEPKFFAGVGKRGTPDNPYFHRMAVFGGSNGKTWLGGQLYGCTPNANVCGSRFAHSARLTRTRSRWDFGTTRNGHRNGGCTDSTPCFSAVMRAYPPGPIIDGTLNGNPGRWMSSQVGPDRWAWISKNRSRAWFEDTVEGGGEAQPWSCWPGHSDPEDSRRVSPRTAAVRRWEYTGRKLANNQYPPHLNPNRFLMSSTVFHAWEGGRGPNDCEPLVRRFGSAGEDWGVFASFGLNSHWVMQ
jgi:hypothetical protein